MRVQAVDDEDLVGREVPRTDGACVDETSVGDDRDVEVIDDLPTGASRIVQRAKGIDLTICAGEVTFRNGEETGARPGRLIRGKR